ncbi:hypothetical protein Lal_00043313 [Lupinus albus]|nr:hypothetical protein Lal_00043313 [Lupinus albus]
MQLGSKEFMVVINCTRPCWVRSQVTKCRSRVLMLTTHNQGTNRDAIIVRNSMFRLRINVSVIAPKHPYNTRLQSKIMSDSDSSSQDSRSELAELKAQMK